MPARFSSTPRRFAPETSSGGGSSKTFPTFAESWCRRSKLPSLQRLPPRLRGGGQNGSASAAKVLIVVATNSSCLKRMAEPTGTIVIEAVEPELDGTGRFAIKRIVGESVVVQADVFKEGHDILVAVLRWRHVAPAASTDGKWSEAPMQPLGNDRFSAEFPLSHLGRYAYTIEAWPDAFRTWVSELERKVAAGHSVRSELVEGAALLRQAALRAPAQSPDAKRLLAAEQALLAGTPEAAVAAALEPGLSDLASRYPD